MKGVGIGVVGKGVDLGGGCEEWILGVVVKGVEKEQREQAASE
jgi:hypothetical protein